MSKKSKTTQAGRRGFLKGMAAVGGAAAVAVTARGVVAETPEASPQQPAAPAAKGYHETPHIRNYYEKARF